MSLLRNPFPRPEMGPSWTYRGAAQDHYGPYPDQPKRPVQPKQRMYTPDEAAAELRAFYAQQDAAASARSRGRSSERHHSKAPWLLAGTIALGAVAALVMHH